MPDQIVLILGDERDAHALHVQQKLTELNVISHIFPTTDFPARTEISFAPMTGSGSIILPSLGTIDFTAIRAVYWRNFLGTGAVSLTADQSSNTDLAQRDSMSAIRTLLNSGTFRCVNSWKAYEYHKEKPLQLAAVHSAGVSIPQTYVGNSAEGIVAFVKAQGTCIFKPIYGGAHTELVTPQHLDPAHLQHALALAPVTIQQYIPGTNVRSYVIGHQVYSAIIESESIDFRADADAKISIIKTPRHIVQQCQRIREVLHLEWTAIDWRRNPQGDYYFLEANPSPMFMGFEILTGLPITDALTERLLCP